MVEVLIICNSSYSQVSSRQPGEAQNGQGHGAQNLKLEPLMGPGSDGRAVKKWLQRHLGVKDIDTVHWLATNCDGVSMRSKIKSLGKRVRIQEKKPLVRSLKRYFI